jgi:hypothetical protein
VALVGEQPEGELAVPLASEDRPDVLEVRSLARVGDEAVGDGAQELAAGVGCSVLIIGPSPDGSSMPSSIQVCDPSRTRIASA